jgi:hypothetical protein
MRILQIAIVSVTSAVAGLVWAVVLVDFVPNRYEQLGTAAKVALLLIPVVVNFLCSVAMSWWTIRVFAVFSIVVLSLSIAGSIRNELQNAGNLTHASLWSEATLYGICVIVLTISWLCGRGFRALVAKHPLG